MSETQDSDEEGDVRCRHRVRARRSRVGLQEDQLFRRTLCHDILVMERACWQRLTEEPAEDVQHASLHGHLARDWACAMPASKVSPDEMLFGNCRMPRNWLIGVVQLNANTPPAATSLYRSSSSDTALSMSQRLGDILFLHLILRFC